MRLCAIPYLVLKGVVKGDQPALDERARLVGHADARPLGHFEAPMQRELRVRRSSVRPHVQARVHR